MIIMLALLASGSVQTFWVSESDCNRSQEALRRGAKVEVELRGGVVAEATRIACVPLSRFIGAELTQ